MHGHVTRSSFDPECDRGATVPKQTARPPAPDVEIAGGGIGGEVEAVLIANDGVPFECDVTLGARIVCVNRSNVELIDNQRVREGLVSECFNAIQSDCGVQFNPICCYTTAIYSAYYAYITAETGRPALILDIKGRCDTIIPSHYLVTIHSNVLRTAWAYLEWVICAGRTHVIRRT